MKLRNRIGFQFGMKWFLGIAAICAVLVGLFFPRSGEPLNGCALDGLQSVWIAPPDRAEVIRECKKLHPDVVIPDNPSIVVEKVFEEVSRCNFFNFQGRRYVHRVRFRSELFLTETFPPESIVVLHDYDHYHLNGGGGQWKAVATSR